MPDKLVPMFCKLSDLPRPDHDWAYEIKWDGVRGVVFIDRGKISIQSRNLLDATPAYPELHLLGKVFSRSQVILDGEIVALTEKGIPSFERLQNRMGLRASADVQSRMPHFPVTYMIFDLLWLNGESLMALPYTERRKRLERLNLRSETWQTPGYHIGDGAALLDASKRQNFEGIIAKRIDSKYEAGLRSGVWRKIKNHLRQELVIAGWLAGEGARHGQIGALLVGYYDLSPEQARKSGREQRLIFAGKVGTGFTDATLRQLAGLLSPLRKPENPFAERHPNHRHAFFVEPKLVADFEFTEWTSDNKVRHPSYKGLRPDKSPREVVREIPAQQET